MRNTRFTALLFGLALLAAAPVAVQAGKEKEPAIPGLPAFGPDKPLVLPDVVERKLDNGLTLWLIERRGLPLISIYLAVRGGSAADPDDLRGLSDILSATLDAGTRKRSSKQIAEELQSLGADLEVGVTPDMTYLGIDGLSGGTGALVEVLADTALNAHFPQAEVELAIENELQSIVANRSQPSYELEQVFYRHLFGDHPYAFVNPRPEAIKEVTREKLVEVHRQRFQPDRSILVMVGNLAATDMEQLAWNHFGNWQGRGGKAAAIPPAPAGPRPALLLLDRPKSVQSTIYVGRPMPPAGHEDEFPLKVANTLFGGSFSSRLTMNIREDKGYTYSPRSLLLDWARGGLFKVAASVRNEVTAATLVEIFYELDRLATTLPEKEELERAQRYLKGSFLLSNETSASIAATLVGYWVDGKTPGDLARYVPGIERVAREDIRQMGRKYLASRKQSVAISGAADAIREELTLFGEASVVKP